MNLLESAGFSRSNPYYIVKQGKVRGGMAPLPLNLLNPCFTPGASVICHDKPFRKFALCWALVTQMGQMGQEVSS